MSNSLILKMGAIREDTPIFRFHIIFAYQRYGNSSLIWNGSKPTNQRRYGNTWQIRHETASNNFSLFIMRYVILLQVPYK